MLYQILANITARLPSALKYRLVRLKPAYLAVLAWRNPVVQVKTAAGPFRWRIDGLTSQQYLLGTCEPYMQKAFMETVHKGAVVYDVGACAGFHTLFCSLLVGPTGKVIAFDPNPACITSIRGQIRLNSGLPATVLPYAVSDGCGTLHLDTSMPAGETFLTKSGGVEVEARSIDSLLAEGAIAPPNIIKIDVEGHEEQVIRGAIETLRRHSPIILCDYNDGTTLPKLTQLLTPLGYAVSAGPPITAIPCPEK
jgi:FkbM family methyltransferase